MSDFTDRKMCPRCGHSNRITAKVCTNCGYSFADMTWAQSDSVDSSAPVVPLKRCPECGHENRISAKVCSQCGHRFRVGSSGQKWCPRCGTVNRLEAKVCIHCGHHFRTNFAAAQDAPKQSQITEPPVVQSPAAAIELPTQFSAPPRLPEPPKVPAVETSPLQRTPTDELDLDGEPAPELTDDDFDAMQRNLRKKDHR